MKALRFPIISITLFFAAGILAGYGLSIPIEFIYAFSAIALAAIIAAYTIAKKQLLPKPYFGMATWLFAFAIGMLVQHLHYPPNQQLHYTHLMQNGETPVLKTVVSERLKPNEFSEKYYFEVLAADGKPATGKLLVTIPNDSLHKLLVPGDAYFIADDLKPIKGALNPYQFDYAAYMEKQGVFHQVRLKDNFVKAGHINTFDSYIGSLREKLIRSFDIHNFDAKTRNVINALLLGQRQDMDKETSDSYANAGVLHILAISGLHFSMLFYILTLLLRPLNRFQRRGELFQLFLILALLWGFAFITGLSASVVRSVVMFSIILIGQYANRNTNIYNSLALSMLLLLLAKPMFLFDVGFQLSYIAVFAIVWLQPIYKKARVSNTAVNYTIDTVLISLAAQIGVLPLSLYYFNQFPLLFLVANLVVIPLSNVILVLGLIVLLLNFIAPPVALFFGHALEWLIMAMNSFIALVASFDKLVLKDIPFTLLLNISLYVILILMVLWMFKKSYARTMALLVSVLVFQGIYTLTVWNSKSHDELVVFTNWNNPMLAAKEDSRITIYSNDSLALESTVIKSYRKGSFAHDIAIKPLHNLLWHDGNKVLVIDSTASYVPAMKPDVLVLVHSPKVNMERMLLQLKPKQVVADATNYRSYIARWAATCHKQKIPFHATAEKGSFRIE